MSKKQHPGPVSEVSGHATASHATLDQLNFTDASITADMVLHETKQVKDLPDLIASQTQSAAPTEGYSFLLKCLFTSILEDVMTQLWILERCNNELAVTKTMSVFEYLKALKYGIYNANDNKDKLDGIDPNNLGCTINKIKKFDADRKYVSRVMVATYISLAESNTFDPLVSCVTSIEELDRYRENLVEEENKNKILSKELYKQIRHQRNHTKTVLYDTEVIISHLRDQVEGSVSHTEVGCRYIDNWQEARTEQHMKMIFDIENKFSPKIEYYKQRSDHELRVHNEVETLVNIRITETLEKIEDWMNKFDKDMEEIDMKIQMKKNEYQDKRDTNRRYEEMYAAHDTLMKSWLQFKAERHATNLYREKMTNSALIVQAWWRGLLVRLGLGPYKLTKKKKKNK